MQKRVVYNFNAQPATETATGHANGKAVKASNAIGKIKRAFFGKGLKLAVFVVLLFASLFCAIGSANWIISQQKDVPSAKDGTKTFNVDDFGLDKYIIVPTHSTYNGNPVCAEMKTKADGGARELPTKAIDKANVKYKVIPYNKPSAQSRLLRTPQNAAITERNNALAANAVTSLPNEDDFKDVGYTAELPTYAGTYAVLITSVVGEVSYGKAIKVFTIAPCPVEIVWSGAVDFIYDGADHLKSINATAKTTDGATIDGIVTKSFTYKAPGATTSTEVTEVKNAGTYTATAEITNPNYALAEGSKTATFTITQRTVTLDWGATNSFVYDGNSHTLTPTAQNVVTGDNLGLNVTSAINAGTYTATAKITNTNYKLSGETSKIFTIKPLKIAFDGIIEHDYAKGGIKLDGNLFKGKFKIAEPESTPSVDLTSFHKEIIDDIINKEKITAKNFSGSEVTTKPENGFYSYTFGKNILAGSTYLISDIKLKPNSNFELTTNSIYLKYKTAKIEKPAENKTEFFTIEDALAASGDISLCGNVNTSSNSSSSNPSYVITAFAKLKNLPGTGFENYKANYEYTLSGTNGSNRKLIVPFEDSLNEKTCLMKTNATYGNVYSALVIHSDISLKLSNSASITVGAELNYNQNISCALVERHGVLSNNGIITAENGCTVSAYGYIKGTGKIILKSGAIGNDVVSIYDFPGGAVILFNMSKVFPTNAFTLHNNACETYIYSGAKYTGFTYFVLDTPIVGNTGYESTADIVGSNSKSGLFAPTSTSGYIIKKVTTLGNYNINDISETNQRTATNTKLQHRDNIEVYGSYKDNTMELSVKGNKFQTSTDKPFPIGLMDISIKEGELTLEKSSYMVMPGSKLKVENGAKLTVNGKVKLSAIQYDTINSATGSKKYTNYFSTESDGEIIVNGELTTASTAHVGGKIVSSEPNASILLSNAMASYIMLIHTDKSNATLSGTVNAFGDIITSQNSYARQDFSTGTYYSTKIGSGYAWFKNSATITYDPNGGTLNGTSENTTQNITLPSGGYTDLPTPTRDYYKFEGWYFDAALTQEATAIYTTCTLYAKWTPIQYTIQYTLPYAECGTLAPDSLSGNQEKELVSPPNKTIIVEGTTYVFLGWYLNPDYSGNSVTSVSAANADNSGIINVYAYYAGNSYSVEYEENPGNITFANGKTVKKPEAQNFSQGVEIPLASLHSLSSYDRDEDFDYYFAGWYLKTDSNETIITSLQNTIDGDITLCAKWIKKFTVNITFTSNDTILETENKLGTIVKYYKDDEVNLQSLYDKFSIATKIDEYYAPHGNIKEYTFIEWQENGTTITSGIKVNRDFDISAYHKRCYYITVQKSPNQTVNGVTGGLGTFYASPSDTTYATAVTCMLIANKERYTPKYSATNATVDTNGIISFANSNSAEDVIINITTQRWFTVINNYGSTDFKIKQTYGDNDGIWYTENSKITISINPRWDLFADNKKAAIFKDGKKVAELEQKYSKKAEHVISSLDGYYTINKLV